MAEDLKLFRSWSSPYGMRVLHALKIKAIEHQTVLEDMTNKSASLLKYNPVHKKIPVLVHNGKPICESLVILEYIDDTWKQRPLLPRDPWDRAMDFPSVNFFLLPETSEAASMNEGLLLRPFEMQLMPSLWRLFISQGKEQEEAVTSAVENLDIAFGLMADLISILEEIAELTLLDAEIFPLLSAWINNFSEDPTIKESRPPRDRIVEKFKNIRQHHLSKVV